MPAHLTPVSSVLFLKKLRRTRVAQRLSISGVSRILGCSPRTAAKLLRPKAGVAVKRSYSVKLARHLQEARPSWEQDTRSRNGLKAVLNAWKGAANRDSRRRVAWRLTALLSEQAYLSYRLSVSSSIQIPYTGEPVRVIINAAVERTRANGRLTINFDLAHRDSIELIFTDWLGNDTFRGAMTPDAVAGIFAKIRSWQKAPH